MSGEAQLDAWIASLKQLPKTIQNAAALVAEDARAAMAAPLASGTSPDGDAWEPRKDGGQPYKNAGAALRVRVVGTRLVFTIGAPEYFGHIGARGAPKHRMLPLIVPTAVAVAIRNRLAIEFRRALGK